MEDNNITEKQLKDGFQEDPQSQTYQEEIKLLFYEAFSILGKLGADIPDDNPFTAKN